MVDTTREMATPMARALGVRLRQARTEAGLTVRDLADRVGVDHSTVVRYESGERPPKPEKVASLLTVCGVVGAEHEQFVQMAKDLDNRHWTSIGLPAQRLQLQALLEFEREATCMTGVSVLLIPGRLQTDEYARQIMVAGEVPAGEIEERVHIRMGRKDLISRAERPSSLRVLISEAVLRTTIGGPDTMYRQLSHILEMTQHPALEVRIIPSTVGWHPGLEGPFLLLEFNNWQPPLVHLEMRESSLFITEQVSVAAYQRAVHKILRVAMTPAESVDLIAREAEKFHQQIREVI